MRSILRLRFIAAWVVSWSVVATPYCTAEDAAALPSVVSTADSHQVVVEALRRYPSPTAEEARAFAETLEQAMCIGDPEVWEDIVAWDAFLDVCFAEVTVDPDWRTDAELGLLSSLKSQDGFLGQVHRSLGEDGSYEFVRVHEIDGRQQILFRLLNTEGVNYHDLILIRDPAGRTQAVDVYVYLSGELFSTTIRRMIRRLTAENKRSIFQKLFAVQQDSLEDIDKLYRMAQSLQQRKPAEALEVYATASEEAQHDKTFLIARYQAATMLPDEAGSYREIEATVGLFRQKHPQDPALDFLAIDEHVVRNEYDRALQAVDRLDRAVGGDAYLHEIRAGILCQAGKPDLAAEQFELAIAGLPHRESAYFGLITLSLYQEDYGNVLKALKRLDQAIELEWNDLHDVPAYAGFVASPYFKQWTKYLESKPAP